MNGVNWHMWPDVKACIDNKRRDMSREAQIDDEDYAKAEKEGTADAWLAFVAKHREDKRVPDAVKAIVKASASANRGEAGLGREGGRSEGADQGRTDGCDVKNGVNQLTK